MRPFVFGLILTFCLISTANAVEIHRWERIPIALPLTVGQERIVFVDQNVKVGLPRSLAGKLRVQSTGGAIYLLASESIAPTRLQLQDMASGEIMLMDIAASPGKPDQPALEAIKIVAGEKQGSRYGEANASKARSKKSSPSAIENEGAVPAKSETPVPVVLTRYAAQALYAPLRTVEPIAGISQVKLKRGVDLTTLLPTQPIKASALGAWRLGSYWVTAVKLQNTGNEHLMLDPRELMGDFIAATFQHPYLGVEGDARDTTVVYLVTRKHGLAESLVPSNIARINPKGERREE